MSRLIEHVTVKHVQKKEGSQYPSAAASNTELLPRSIGLPPAAAALTRPVAGRRAGVSARPPLESVSTAPSVAEAAQAPAVLSAAHNGALSDLSDLESIPDLPDASDSLPSIQSRADGAGRVIAGDGAVVGSSGSSGNARRSNGDSSTTSASPPDIPEDLNRVSEEELKRAKEAMNATFEAHALKPGDPGYVHDKVVIFDGEKVDGWTCLDECFPNGFHALASLHLLKVFLMSHCPSYPLRRSDILAESAARPRIPVSCT